MSSKTSNEKSRDTKKTPFRKSVAPPLRPSRKPNIPKTKKK